MKRSPSRSNSAPTASKSKWSICASVKPLDTDTVLASVARTGRLLCVGEAFPWGGVTAEVIARVATEGFHLLDAAPARINAKDTPIPYHPNLWSEHRPNAKTIAAKVRQILAE